MSAETLSFGFNDLFWLTLLVLFSATLLAGLVRRYRKDRCLKLLEDYHVTVVHGNGNPLWGTLEVTSRGVEGGEFGGLGYALCPAPSRSTMTAMGVTTIIYGD